jgi:cytochrome c551/c552
VTLAAGWGPGARSLTAQDLPAPTQNAVAGAAVFGEKGCIRCHSINGVEPSLGPDLRTIGSTRTFQDLTAALWNHLPDMNRRMAELGIERPHLSGREAGDLFAYLYTLGYFDAAGDAERGKRLFSEMSCIRCHQVEGVGGVVGPVLDHVGARGAPIEIAAAMWNHGPAMIEAAEARGIARPRMSGHDLTDLIAFLEAAGHEIPAENLYVLPGDADAGALLIEDRGCVECHGNPGSGGLSAPDLAGVSRNSSLIDFVALMWNKAPGMMAALRARDLEFPHLEPQDFANVVAYLYSVNYFSGGGQASRGQVLIAGKGCGKCHGADLSSNPGLDHPSSITAALWNHLEVLEAGEDLDEDWPSFTGREMGDLMAFFQASSP